MIEISGVNYELTDLRTMSTQEREKFNALSKRIGDAYNIRNEWNAEQASDFSSDLDIITRMVLPSVGDKLSTLNALQKFTILNTALGLANAIREVKFKGELYPVHSFHHLAEIEALRIIEILERGSEAPDELPNIVRDCLSLFVPMAAERVKQWSFNDAVLLMMEVYPLIDFDRLPSERLQRFTEAFKHVLLLIQHRTIEGQTPPSELS